MNNILIVKYIGQFAPYYYLGISGYTESFPERGDRILFYDEHTGNVYEETLSTDELFTLDTWGGRTSSSNTRYRRKAGDSQNSL